MKYAFHPYNPKYPALAKKEIDRIKTFLKKNIQIEHFGSTAVPGLGGKNLPRD